MARICFRDAQRDAFRKLAAVVLSDLEIHAMYGIDSTTPHDNIVDSWQLPTGTWSIDQVITPVAMSHSQAAIRPISIAMRRRSSFSRTP